MTRMPKLRHPIFAELTAPGRGGISTIALVEPLPTTADYAGLLAAIYRPAGGRHSSQSAGYGYITDAGGATLDEVIVRRAEGQGVVEIHCHGGSASVAAICDRLRQAGCRQVGWRRMISVIGLRRGDSAIARAGQMLLPDLQSEAAVQLVLGQMGGVLEQAVGGAADAALRGDGPGAMATVDGLLEQWMCCGRFLASAPRVAIVGAPNVGKSSLLNALAGTERAIVDETPGTTRDVVSERAIVDGLAIELLDTAGVRQSDDRVEQLGVSLALEQAGRADVRLYLLDLSRQASAEEVGMVAQRRRPCLVVGTKADLLPQEEGGGTFGFPLDVRVSSTSGAGLEELRPMMLAALGFCWPSADKVAVPFTPGQAAGLMAARGLLDAGLAGQAEVRLRRIARRGCHQPD